MDWKRPRRLTYLLRERQPRGKGGFVVHTGGLKPRGKGVSVYAWSCAPAACGCAVPVRYAPVDCLLCCVLFSSLLSRLCCSPPTTCLQMGWLRGGPATS